MMVFRFAAMVAALVTVTLNAAYGFKTSAVLEYAILFAALNAALDISKCACFVGAAKAWHAGHRLAAALLFLLFWPLLGNSLWCGFSEITFNRSSEAARFQANAQGRDIIVADHQRITAELADLAASQLYKSSAACAVPKLNRERMLCDKHADALKKLQQIKARLIETPPNDPAPQMSLLVSLTGVDLAALTIAASFLPIALAELCGSLGFYLTTRRDGTGRRWKRFRRRSAVIDQPDTQNTPKPQPLSDDTPAIRWTPLTS